MTKELLYDFTLHHTYSRLGGFLSIVLAGAIAIIGLIRALTLQIPAFSLTYYALAAIAFMAYTPLLLKFRAKHQVEQIEEYANPVYYTFDPANGITMEYNGKTRFIHWDRCERVVVAPKNIGIYYGKNDALILPKDQFGDAFTDIMTVVMACIVGRVYRNKDNAPAEGGTTDDTAGKKAADTSGIE